jgi:hypothetical protein
MSRSRRLAKSISNFQPRALGFQFEAMSASQ